MQHLNETTADYKTYIPQMQSQNFNFSAYNSLSIANDIEMLRISANVDQRFLFGTPFDALYNYCDTSPIWETPIDNIEPRIWHLYEQLNHQQQQYNRSLFKW